MGGQQAACPLSDLHDVFDAVFSEASSPLQNPVPSKAQVEVQEDLFSTSEVETALKSLQTKLAVGPDGVSVPELRKVHAAILTLILNNWIGFSTIPLEMRVARTVFIPKRENLTGPGDYCPVTISPILY